MGGRTFTHRHVLLLNREVDIHLTLILFKWATSRPVMIGLYYTVYVFVHLKLCDCLWPTRNSNEYLLLCIKQQVHKKKHMITYINK